MITIKSAREIKGMAKSGAILAAMHVGLRDIIKPGISSWEIEKFAKEFLNPMVPRLSRSVLKVISMLLVSVSMMRLPMLYRARA